MRHRVFFSCLLLLSCAVQAENFLDPQALRDQVALFLQEQLRGEYVGVEPENIEIAVSNLDPRLKLPKCETELNNSITSPRPYGANISVKVNCDGSKPWTIYVPARIDTYAEVAVVARGVERGSILTAADIRLTRMNTSQAGYGHIREMERIVGMEVKRPLRAGDAIRLSHLKSPQVVRKGDRVVLEASTSGISVVTSGRALLNGQVGDQIQVRNEKSNRVVDAEVVGPGRVRIPL